MVRRVSRQKVPELKFRLTRLFPVHPILDFQCQSSSIDQLDRTVHEKRRELHHVLDPKSLPVDEQKIEYFRLIHVVWLFALCWNWCREYLDARFVTRLQFRDDGATNQ